MTTLREAAQQALEALGLWATGRDMDAVALNDLIFTMEAALAEPVQEPYCYVYEYDGVFGLHREFYPKDYNGQKPDRTVALYTAPPQRKPLTKEEIQAIWAKTFEMGSSANTFARAIERAHGIV